MALYEWTIELLVHPIDSFKMQIHSETRNRCVRLEAVCADRLVSDIKVPQDLIREQDPTYQYSVIVITPPTV